MMEEGASSRRVLAKRYLPREEEEAPRCMVLIYLMRYQLLYVNNYVTINGYHAVSCLSHVK